MLFLEAIEFFKLDFRITATIQQEGTKITTVSGGLKLMFEARSKRRTSHVPNLTDELSKAEDRRLNQFGSAG